MTMKIVYVPEQLPTEVTKTLFLAGPTPRNNSVDSWRPQAIQYLEKQGYDGVVYVPEPRNGQFLHAYDDQIEWKLAALNAADSIVFWVPRELTDMPAFTTNVEFGMWIQSGKVAFGSPNGTVKMDYLKHLAQKEKVTHFTTLENTLDQALSFIGEGAYRVGGETQVPLSVWKTASFQQWITAQKQAGNRLDGAEIKWTFRVGPNKDIVFMWIAHVNVFVASENRHKDNEFVVSRTNTSSVVLYKKEQTILDTQLVMVKEFRRTGSTKDGFVWEVPGGSSFKPNESPTEVASHEVYEEIGLQIDSSRIRMIQQRQSAATVLANQIVLFAVEITEDELAWLKTQKGIAKGTFLTSDDSEMTFTEIKTFQEILSENVVDWSNIGMISKVLLEEYND